jgi:hypothetical protein
MYEDVMADKEVASYLPEVNVHQSKYPEKDYFFSILSTVRQDYL